jgi:hypothetical protein
MLNLLQPLNLPVYSPILSPQGNVIYDPIRKKNILLTPEEWVRQHVINYLVNHLHYPASRIAVEKQLTYNQLKRRFDVLVYDSALKPYLIVECKAYDVPITQVTFNQIAMYNKVVRAHILVVTNGITHYCSIFNTLTTTYEFVNEIPAYTV